MASIATTIKIAKCQKGILYCILANLASFFFPPLYFITIPFQLYFVYGLARALGSSVAILWCVAMFIPVVSLLCLLLLSQRATKAIREHGFSVGLMGARLSEFEDLSDVPESGETGDSK